MNNEYDNIVPLKEKISIIKNDLVTAFNAYTRHESNINILRGWSLTLFIGFEGLLVGLKPESLIIFVPYIIVQVFFMYLEARQTSLMLYIGNEARKVEKIFMETNTQKFIAKINKYKFRDLRIKKEVNPFFQRHLINIKLMFSFGRIIWYSSLIVTILITWIIYIQS